MEGHGPRAERNIRRGVFASLAASILFGVMFFLPSLLGGLTANQILAWRLVVTIPVVVVLLTLTPGWPDVQQLVRRIRARPTKLVALLLGVILLGILGGTACGQAVLIAETSNSRVILSLTRTPPVSSATFQTMP
jgi:hypothetical protein